MDQVLAPTDPGNTRSQAVAVRLGMRDEGSTQRWFGLTSRQFRQVITGSHDGEPDRDQA
jgi:RimJ/RimL family protein N-acetyltransferase